MNLATCEDSTQVDDIVMDDETDEGFEDSSISHFCMRICKQLVWEDDELDTYVQR